MAEHDDADDEFYLKTLTLDQERVKAAIAPLTPEQQRMKMMLEVATHGAHIASIHNSLRTLRKAQSTAEKTTDSIAAEAQAVRSSITFLLWSVGIGFAGVIVAFVWRWS